MEFLGPLISGGSSLLGSLFGSSAASKQAELNRQMQLQFAQNAISWRVEDAKRAGVHPLFALGASTSSYSPVSSGAGDILSEGIGKMGQDVGRAFAAAGTREERQMQLLGSSLDIERKGLENEMLRQEIASKSARLTGAAVGPPVPSASGSSIWDRPDQKLMEQPPLGLGLPGGGVLPLPPKVSQGQSWNDAFDDAVSAVAGIFLYENAIRQSGSSLGTEASKLLGGYSASRRDIGDFTTAARERVNRLIAAGVSPWAIYNNPHYFVVP